MIVAITLITAGLGFACWLIFNLAVQALPFFAAVTAGLFAYKTGAGLIGASVTGLIAGAATLHVGHYVFSVTKSAVLKRLVAAIFALPATVAGYHLVLGLSDLVMPSQTWRHLFALIGAAAIGSTAWSRFIARPFDQPGCAVDSEVAAEFTPR